MSLSIDREFGSIITRLIQKENLSKNEARAAFISVLNDDVTEMQQGAFLAALTAKGETADEVAGSWAAIYELDTAKVSLPVEITPVENSGTGMDTFKTFNISTAASLIAAAAGVPMARHGARAITSFCGTVDMAEALGVDVECSADVVAKSIETAGIGLFNGMSPLVHPKALGRILSKIHFGSTLNIAASLANPALPSIGVRGVYSKSMVRPVAEVMKAIGYKRAVILHGTIDGSNKGMDEASVCGPTHGAQINDDGIAEFTFDPKQIGLKRDNPEELTPKEDIGIESKRFVALMNNQEEGARKNAAVLNAGMVLLAADKVNTIEDGIQQATTVLESGAAMETTERWVRTQTTNPEEGLTKLYRLVA